MTSDKAVAKTELHSPEGSPAAEFCRNYQVRNGKEMGHRRVLGAYYTPENVARILVQWALSNGPGTILDPSFGGCAFLKAAAQVLAEQGIQDPGRLVFGVDVDPACVDHVRNSKQLKENNCIVRNFLDIDPTQIPGSPFQAIVGNPPYIRHHWIKGAERVSARAAIANSGIELPARASTWAYFLVHALRFLAPGGRLAMLVPEAILQADYAAPIRNLLCAGFRNVSLVHISERLFKSTCEPVVVVAASDYGVRGEITTNAINSVESLGPILNKKVTRRDQSVNIVNGRRISPATLQLIGELVHDDAVAKLGEFARIRIGFVTGANTHFIRSYRYLTRLGIPREAWLPVVARTKWLSGLTFTKNDHQILSEADCRTFLVRPTAEDEEDEGIRKWILEGAESGVPHRYKCARRAPWFRVDLPEVPDAYATCTRFGSPLLALNRAGYQCSNTLHSVKWQFGPTIGPEIFAVGFLTSLVSVWAELHARRYGGGVLKLEPSTLSNVPVPLVSDAAHAFDELDKLMRAGREDEARMRADEIVLGAGMNVPQSDLRMLQQAQLSLMSQRRPPRNGKSRG